MIVFELPPRAVWSIWVSFESRYGMKTFFFGLFAASARDEMTLPSAESDLLIAAPSFSRSPVAPARCAASECHEVALSRTTASVSHHCL